jgi:hypothetical protein
MKRTSRPAKRTSRRPNRNPKLVGNDGRPNDPTFLDTITSFEDLLRKPGAYYTTTGQQAYGVAKALEWHPFIKPGEETFYVEGSVLHFEVLAKPAKKLQTNPPTVGWGTTSDYYERRIESYDKWELAWWREVAQNSRDARATRFDWVCEAGVFTDPDTKETTPAMVVIARDNGTGMDEATLRKAFFTRGGSVKEAGAVGGFGDAKELILTPWLGYEVRTRDLIARGRHEDLFMPGIEAGQKFLQGTEVRVWMPMNRTTGPEFAMSILERSYLPGITTTVNGQRVDAALRGGTKVIDDPIRLNNGTEVGRIEIYHQPRARRHGVYIRGNGVFMFEESGNDTGQGSFKGVVYVDIMAPPRSVFTKKRDALSWESSARETVKRFVAKLSVDPMSALKAQRAKDSTYRKIVEGTGALDAREGIAAEVAASTLEKFNVEQMAPKKAGRSFSISEAVLEAAVQQVTQAKTDGAFSSTAGSGAAEVDLSPHVEAVRAVLGGVELMKTEQVAGAIRMAAWKPDFLIEQTLPGYKVPKKLEPATMQPKYLRLIRLWSELCKYALIQVALFKPFGVGWVFDTETDKDGNEMVTGAASLKHAGVDWLLLNPIKLRSLGDFRYEEEDDHFDLGSERDLEELCASVIHEVTHMQGYGRHDQAYAYALTDNIKIAFGMKAAAKKILKAVNVQAREEGAARKAGQAEKSSVPWDVIVGRVTYAMQAWDGFSWSGLRSIESGETAPADLAADLIRHYVSPASTLEDFRRHPPKRSEFVLKPKTVVKVHDVLAERGVFRDITDEQAREIASMGWQHVPADPREKIAPPSEIGVYSWIKGGKSKDPDARSDEYEYVLRTGYVGQRGEEVARVNVGGGGYGPYNKLQDMTPGLLGEYEREKNIHRRYDDNLVWIPIENSWRVNPSGWHIAGLTYGEGTNGVLDVKVEKEREGTGYITSYEGGPRSRTLPSVAEAQKFVVDWAIEHRDKERR